MIGLRRMNHRPLNAWMSTAAALALAWAVVAAGCSRQGASTGAAPPGYAWYQASNASFLRPVSWKMSTSIDPIHHYPVTKFTGPPTEDGIPPTLSFAQQSGINTTNWDGQMAFFTLNEQLTTPPVTAVEDRPTTVPGARRAHYFRGLVVTPDSTQVSVQTVYVHALASGDVGDVFSVLAPADQFAPLQLAMVISSFRVR